jgi:outer membrane protein insertion porin family
MKPGRRGSRTIGMDMRSGLAIGLVLAASLGHAQQKKRTTPPPPAPKQQEQSAYPLETLKIQGNQRISSEKIIAASGLKIGATVEKADFDKARARLLAGGAFESVGYEFKPSAANTGYDATFQVVEVDQLYSYRFEELPLTDDAIRAALRKQEPLLGEQIPATKEVIDRYVSAIQQLVGDKVTVTGKLSSDLPGPLMLLFRPNTPRAQIAEVHFSGNQVLPAPMLMRALGEVAIGTAYSEAAVRVLLDSSIRPLYDGRGRIRVSFPKTAVEPATTVDGVIVTVTVDEGPSYSMGQVKFAGVAPAEATELQRIANIQSKDIANFDDVKAALDKIYLRYRARGYLKATSRVDRNIDDKAHAVDLVITMDPGPQYRMGKLEIDGLDINSEPAIRKIWTVRTGAPYQPDYPDSFLNDIRAQGLFDNLGKTRAEINIDENTHIVAVTLHFAGATAEDEKKRRKKN